MGVGVTGYSPQALSRSTRLVRGYADSADGNVTAEVGAILDEVGRDEAELKNLIASLAGLAGHAMRAMAVRLEADLGIERELPGQLPRLSQQRTKVLDECTDALRSWTDKRERRSGLDRRLGSERRRLVPGNPKEQVNPPTVRRTTQRRARPPQRHRPPRLRRHHGVASGIYQRRRPSSLGDPCPAALRLPSPHGRAATPAAVTEPGTGRNATDTPDRRDAAQRPRASGRPRRFGYREFA